MTNKQMIYWWLDNLEGEGKDATDPTYLMQAFSLTRQKSLEMIQEWQDCQLQEATDG